MLWKGLIGLVKETAKGWYGGQTFLFGAALAFYGSFALAPTLVIAIAVAGMLFGEEAAQGQLAASLEVGLGPAVAAAISEALANVHVTGSGWIAILIGLGFIVYAATGLFMQLQAALNAIWGVQPKPGWGLWEMVRNRLFAAILVLVLGILLLLLLIANSVLGALHAYLPDSSWSGEVYLWEGLNWLLMIALLTLLFVMIYKLLPDVIITWRDVCVGAFITALLFALGNYLIGFYLCRVAPTFAFGADSSLLVVMLWVYFSSQVLLFGAEFTRNYARKYGEPVRPADYAMYLPWRVGTGHEDAASTAGRSKS